MSIKNNKQKKGKISTLKKRKPKNMKNIKRPIKKVAPKREKRHNMKETGPARATPESYEELLLNGIRYNSNEYNEYVVDDCAILFNRLLSNLTPSLKEMQFRYGAGIGRMLYKSCMSSKNPIYNINPVIGLVDFFQSIGYKQIIDNSNDISGFSFAIYDSPEFNIGSCIHNLESGIISGFISTMRGMTTIMREHECISNGDDRCAFTETKHLIKSDSNILIEDTIVEFTSYMSNRIIKKEYTNKHFSMLYNQLLWHSLLHIKYSDIINKLLYYSGIQMGNAINLNMHLNSKQKTIKELERIISLLNFGELKVKSVKPLNITVEFDVISSRRQFVDASLAFIKGFLESQGMRKQLDAIEEKRYNKYLITIKEKK